MAIAPMDTHPAACGWSLFGRSTVECLFHYQNNQPAVPQLCHISRNMLGQCKHTHTAQLPGKSAPSDLSVYRMYSVTQ